MTEIILAASSWNLSPRTKCTAITAHCRFGKPNQKLVQWNTILHWKTTATACSGKARVCVQHFEFVFKRRILRLWRKSSQIYKAVHQQSPQQLQHHLYLQILWALYIFFLHPTCMSTHPHQTINKQQVMGSVNSQHTVVLEKMEKIILNDLEHSDNNNRASR